MRCSIPIRPAVPASSVDRKLGRKRFATAIPAKRFDIEQSDWDRLSTDYSTVGSDILPSDPARQFADQEGNDFGDFRRLPEAMQRRRLD